MWGWQRWQPFLLLFIYKYANYVIIYKGATSATPIFAPDRRAERRDWFSAAWWTARSRFSPLRRARVGEVAAVRGVSLRTVEHVTEGHR